MAITVQCSNAECGTLHNVVDELAGRRFKCRKCGTVVAVSGSTVDNGQKRSEINRLPKSNPDFSSSREPAELLGTQPASRRNAGPSLPQRITRFEIMSRLGAGGFGTVYRARDPQLDREVALKVPRPGTLDDPDVRERFYREAKAAARLQHPHIVPIYDAGEDQEQSYIACAFIDGRTLSEWLKQGSLDPRTVVDIVRKLAEALHYAHSQGVIHRDVKPANVMLDDKGDPHLMDFGLARLEHSSAQWTQDGLVLGTPAYMSPEQATGIADRVMPSSDQYSLGVVLYQLLTGRTPFDGPPQIVLYNVLNQPIPAPRTIRAEIPRDLETICLKMLAKEPSARYTDCQALADDLERWLKDEPIQARSAGNIERFVRWCRREPVVAGLAAALFCALVLGVMVSSLFALKSSLRTSQAKKEAERADGEAKRAEDSAQRAVTEAGVARAAEAQAAQSAELERKQRERADARELEARRNLYAAHMNLAQSAWEDARVGRVRQLLELYGSDPSAELCGFEWHYWNRLCRSELQTLNFHGRDVAFSPDAARIAIASYDHTVKFWDVVTGQEIRALKGHSKDVARVALSPDGTRIASASSDQTVKLWDVATGQEIRTFHGTRANDVVFSPDSKRFASTGNGTLKVSDAATGGEIQALNLKGLTYGAAALNQDGSRIAAVCNDQTAKLWDVATGHEIHTLKGHKGQVTRIIFSPNDAQIATVSEDRTVKLWDAASGQEIRTLTGHADRVSCVAFTPDGARIASSSWDETVKLWDVATGQEIRTLKGFEVAVNKVVFSFDGTRLLSVGGNTIKVWNPDIDQEALTVTMHGAKGPADGGVAFSPDGTQIASAFGDSSVTLWNAATGQEMRTLNGRSRATGSVAFSPNGARIAAGQRDNAVKLWNPVTGDESRMLLSGHTEFVRSIAFSPDGARIATASNDQTVKLWDAATGAEIRSLAAHSNYWGSVAFSPDGARIAAAGDNATVQLWNAATGQEAMTLRGHKIWVTGIAFSRDGARIASSSRDGTIKLWDAQMGRLMQTLLGHTADVMSVAFSPDGARIVSASLDRTVKIWDAATGQETLTLKGHTGAVRSVAFSPDGGRIASISDDGTVKIWDGRPLIDARVNTSRNEL